MLQFSDYKNYKACFKKNKISLVYDIENNSKESKIENLIESILTKKNSFVFESVEKGVTRGRYTIFGYDSDRLHEVKNNNIFLNKKIVKKKNTYNYLKELIKKFNYDLPKDLPPMALMLVGYFGYDTIRFIEKIPRAEPNSKNWRFRLW